MVKRSYFVMGIALLVGLTLTFGVLAEDRNLRGKLTLDQVVASKSFPSYQQAPVLDKLVESGKIPSVKDRLPEEPLVFKKTMMVDGVGEYGGVWRDTFGATPTGWNRLVGQTPGWYGINQMVQENLVMTGPMWMLKNPEPIPSLAKSWEWSEDGRTLTMHLRKGVKWSDGVEFTAEDVLFTYQDNIINPKVPFGSAGPWTFNGKVTELEKVDDYTIKWHFGTAFPVQAFFQMARGSLPIEAAHLYKQYHPKYNSEATYSEYQEKTPPEALPAVVLGSFVPVEYKPDQVMVLVRNPYYWKVDEEGKQLPYFDEVRFFQGQTDRSRDLNVIAGRTDRSHVSSNDMFTLVLKAAKERGAHFEVKWSDYFKPFSLDLNLSLYAGVDDEKDKALRELFREKKFRQAISHAIDREGIAQATFPGPATAPFYGGYQKASPYYDEKNVVKYEYAPDQARELLSELGFEDTDGDKILNWPEDSPRAGENLSIALIVSEGNVSLSNLAEMIQPMFREVGINLIVRVLKGSIVSSRTTTGDWEAQVTRNNARLTPWANPETVGPVGPQSPFWHIASAEGERELLPFEEEIGQMLKDSATITDSEERSELFGKILKTFTENVYEIGLYQKKAQLAIAKRFRNIADDIPLRMWDYTINNGPIEIFWAPKDEQLEVQYTDLIPTPETYQSKKWYQGS